MATSSYQGFENLLFPIQAPVELMHHEKDAKDRDMHLGTVSILVIPQPMEMNAITQHLLVDVKKKQR